jgi:hypothetical protein
VGSLNRWCPDRSAALEYVDDDHRRTAVPANEGWPHYDCRDVVGTAADTGRRSAQQLAYLRKILAPRWIREQAVMADAVETARQHVQRKHSTCTVADFVDAREDRLLANGIDV